MDYLLLAAGLALLVVGAEALVRGASRLAAAFGIAPLVIGLTVVAYGTSAPEMAVSIMSAYKGEADLAFGNVVGSNIFNVLLILGASALVVPLVVAQQLVRLDVPLMIALSFLVAILGWDGSIGRIDGLLLAAGAVAYTVFLIRQSRREKNATIEAEYDEAFGDHEKPTMLRHVANVAFIAAGLALLILGSRFLVRGAVSIAESLGVSELVIGLTIVAAGTSLPEVATSLIAAFRGERDIAVGNVVGSNIFNILLVLGVAGSVSPSGIPVAAAALRFDLPVMIAVAVACLPVFFTGHVISRWEGAVFLGYYAAYTAYLVLDATEHDALPAYSAVMGWFVIPLTALTLAVVVYREWRARKPSTAA